MIKGFRQIAFLTVISRVLGMVRDMAFAYFFGRSSMMDIWTIAFKIPNLSRRIFGEGAAASSVIPIYSQQFKESPQQAARLARTVITVVFLILSAVVIIGLIVLWWYCKYHAPLEDTRRMLTLTALMLPYMILICTVAIMAGVLNAHGHFAIPAAAPMILNIFIIASICVSGWLLKMPPQKQVFFVGVAVLLAGVSQVLVQTKALAVRGVTLAPAWDVKTDAFKKIIILMGPMVLGLVVTQLNTFADDIVAKSLSGSQQKGEFFFFFGRQIRYPVWEGAVSSLYFSQRLYQFPLGVLGISLATAIFPLFSAAAADNNHQLLAQTIRRGLNACFFIALPATVGLILVSRPLTAVLYQRGEFTAEDTSQVKTVLIFYSLGLCGYFLQQLVTRAFYSIQDSKWPARTAALAVLVNVVLNLTLIWSMGVAGLALATALCSYLQVIILLLILNRQFRFSFSKHFKAITLKTTVGTIIMTLFGILCMAVFSKMPGSKMYDLLRILTCVFVCSTVYIAAARIMGNQMLSLLVTGHKTAKTSD